MLIFKNVFLIDGTGNPPVKGANVFVEGKKIVAVDTGISIPEGANVIDLQGKTMVPGFSDAHTHLGGSDQLNRAGIGSRFATYEYAENRESALKWGVTTIRSAGDYTPEILKYRDEVDEGRICSPRVIAAGRMLQAQGGHPGFTVFFSDQEILDNVCVLCDDSTDIDTEVKKLADAGVDWIKTFISETNKMDYPNKVPRLSEKTLRAIADTAHKYGKPLMVHVDDISDLAEAVKIGADSIEHTINVGTTDHKVTDYVLKLLKDSGTWVVPTMVATRNHDGSIPDAEPVYHNLVKAVGKMIAAGVNLGVGCDSGIPFVPYGECVHIEMELLTDAGMTPMAAICTATGGNARMFHKQDLFGTVEPGKLADLVILGKNPLEDIKNTRDIKMVVKEGRVVVDNLFSN